MTIQIDLKQLDSIKIEISRLYKQIKNLQEAKKQTEARIRNYILKNNLTSVTYKGKKITPLNKQIAKRKSNKQHKEDMQEVLYKYGIRNSDKIVAEIIESRYNNKQEKETIKFN